MRATLEERALDSHPDPAALLVTGSYARGTATPSSDLDLRLLTWSPGDGYASWFVPSTRWALACPEVTRLPVAARRVFHNGV